MKNKLLISAISIFMIMLVLNLTDQDDHIFYFIDNLITTKETKNKSIWLPDYQANIHRYPIPGVEDNASGITYNYDTKSLWIVVNYPTYLVELDLQFNLLRRINLVNFKDTEAVVYIGYNSYLITDERDQTITLATINKQTNLLDNNKLPQIAFNLYGESNKGLEGIAIDSVTNTIYTVRERNPMKLFKINGFIENSNRINIENFDKIDLSDLYIDDLSGLHFDSETGHLLFLSHESKILVEVNLQGKKISYMDLEKGFNGLKQSIPQAEGVALDENNHLYIVSEPNLLYRFKNIK